ncbi:MAG: ribose-phosphate diphosphokinase [Acidilobaceae archaeon]
MRARIAGLTEHARSIALKLSDIAGFEYLDLSHKRFPDGEVYVRVERRLDGSRVVLVADCSPPRQSECIVESVVAADALYGSGAEEVILYAPYLPYARQDRVFLEGEAVSARAVLRALYNSGFRRLAVVEAHSERVGEHFPGVFCNIRPLPYMAKVAGVSSSSIVVAPDSGALERARSVASATGSALVSFKKTRDRVTGEIRVEARDLLEARGREAYIVDDMISTGSTIAEVARILLEIGVARVSVLVAHYLNLPGSMERLVGAGVSRVIAANTIAPAASSSLVYVDISEVVADELKRCLS